MGTAAWIYEAEVDLADVPHYVRLASAGLAQQVRYASHPADNQRFMVRMDFVRKDSSLAGILAWRAEFTGIRNR